MIRNGRDSGRLSFNLWEKSEYERPTGRPWSRFSESYISATGRPIDKRSFLLDSLIPSSKYETASDVTK